MLIMKLPLEKKTIHCVVVGDGMVGKTCLTQRLTEGEFTENYEATVFENYGAFMSVDGEQYLVSIYDTAGQSDFQSLRAFAYKDCEVFVICFSIKDRESFNNVTQFWLPELKHYNKAKKPIVLVGTQNDCREEFMDEVSSFEGRELADRIGAEKFIECSSWSGECVRDVFNCVVNSALKFRKKKKKFLGKIFGR